jgi:hypothetical protein
VGALGRQLFNDHGQHTVDVLQGFIRCKAQDLEPAVAEELLAPGVISRLVRVL